MNIAKYNYYLIKTDFGLLLKLPLNVVDIAK